MIRKHESEEKVSYGNGATRSNMDERYDLICPTGHRRIALRYGLGAAKHGPANWTEGMPIDVILNHLEKHIVEYKKNGNKLDDNTAAIIWAGYALAHYEEGCQCGKRVFLKPDATALPSGPERQR
jgi:hypothetical protein